MTITAARFYQHISSGQRHMVIMVVSPFPGAISEVVTLETNIFTVGVTHSWRGSAKDFEREFRPL